MAQWVVECKIASPIEFIDEDHVLSVSFDNEAHPTIVLIINKKSSSAYWINVAFEATEGNFTETWEGVRKSGGGERSFSYLPTERKDMTAEDRETMLRHMRKIIRHNREEICAKLQAILEEAAELIQKIEIVEER